LSVSHWESYYHGGALAACTLGSEDSYTLELRSVWEQFFAQLADGARVLDLATGNGAIALIARDAARSHGRQFEVHGTDLARINPPRDVRGGAQLFQGITFHPGVASEALPFAAASFAAVSGQYALEYADQERALAQVLRVLEPGAGAQFVLHHAGSVLAERARVSLRHADVVLSETKLYRKLRRLLEAQMRSPTAARRAADELSAALAQVRETGLFEADRRLIDVTLDAVGKLLGLRGELERAALEREIDAVEGELRDGVRRLNDLLGVALGDEAMAACAATARRLGFAQVRYEPLRHGRDALVGWMMHLRKPRGGESAAPEVNDVPAD
jgi:ubiquinone/menaquinone biosynthesis C-methylase UbiE